MKLFKNKQSNDISVIQGGFSDIRLWPVYMVYSGSILYFAPRYGLFNTITIFSILAVCVLVLVIKISPVATSSTYDFDAWIKDLNLAYDNNQPLPELNNYLILIPVKAKQPKAKKTTKRLSLRPYLDLRAKIGSNDKAIGHSLAVS